MYNIFSNFEDIDQNVYLCLMLVTQIKIKVTEVNKSKVT